MTIIIDVFLEEDNRWEQNGETIKKFYKIINKTPKVSVNAGSWRLWTLLYLCR